MGELLDGPRLKEAILLATTAPDVRCAVAFWGKGALKLFDNLKTQRVRIICNLRTGGTNPHVIRDLVKAGARVRHRDDLHAKVYIGADTAIVASANASANGLGLEAGEQAHWLECGTRLPEGGAAAQWFDALWEHASTREITSADMRAAMKAWRNRQGMKVSVHCRLPCGALR